MYKIAFYNIHRELNRNNFMFDNANATIGDDLLKPFMEMKEYASEKGIQLFTMEAHRNNEANAYVFIDMPRKNNKFFQEAIQSQQKLYLIMFESELIKKENYLAENHAHFEKIFTHNDKLVDNKKFIKINFSHTFPKTINMNISNKEKLCTLIAGNKKSTHPLELYSKRVEAIRWFEENHPQDFDLYGVGWEEYTFHGPRPIRLLNKFRFMKKLLAEKFPSYKGKIDRKRDVLAKYKFAICYENARDIDGYITEKIFDCFFAGCVPIYWGANNITDHIPSNCFIDRRDFKTYEDLYHFMKNMSDVDFLGYLKRIKDFLSSSDSYQFTCDYFAKTIIEGIICET